MKGIKQPKKPTAKQALEKLSKLELQNAMLKLDIRNRTIALLDNLWSYETVIDQLSEQAGTITEFRKWYKDFKDAVNTVDIQAVNHKEQLREALAKVDIYITDMPNHGELIDSLWNKE